MAAAWEPTPKYLERSRLRAFAERQGHRDYHSLLRWSIEDSDGFWRATERDLELVWRVPYTKVLDSSQGIPWTTWWTGGRGDYVAAGPRHHPRPPPPLAPGGGGGGRPPPFVGRSPHGARRAAGGPGPG